MTKIYLGSDHAGFTAKEEIKKILKKLNYIFEDLGTNNELKSVDYPIFAKKVCEKVILDKNSLGILICGSGAGMQIAANKINGIRAVFCPDIYAAKMARFDNNSNVLTLRNREFNHNKYLPIIETFLKTKFSNNERHSRRIKELEKLEELKELEKLRN